MLLSQILGIINPTHANKCYGKPLQKYCSGRGSYGLLGVNPYVCRDTELVLRLTKANIFLKVIILSGSELLVCCDQLLSTILMHM